MQLVFPVIKLLLEKIKVSVPGEIFKQKLSNNES